MTLTHTVRTRAVAAVAALLALAGTSATAHAQDSDALVAVCTDSNGALFRIDNGGDREYDFTLREAGMDGEAVSGSAYPIGRGGAFAYLPAGADAELVVRDEVVAEAEADGAACPTASMDQGRPMCEGLRLDEETRQALFVGASEFRGVSRIDITVENGRVLVYDPHALFVIDAGGAPAPVFEVGDRMSSMRTTATFDAGVLFNAGYGLLLQGNASGPVAFFATIYSPGGVVECDPQFGTAGEGESGVEGLVLEQNAPNPFGSAAGTEIRFSLSQAGDVALRVYDVLGRRVATLVDGDLPAGPHSVTWGGRNEAGQPVASGTYLYQLEAEGRTLTQRMTVVK